MLARRGCALHMRSALSIAPSRYNSLKFGQMFFFLVSFSFVSSQQVMAWCGRRAQPRMLHTYYTDEHHGGPPCRHPATPATRNNSHKHNKNKTKTNKMMFVLLIMGVFNMLHLGAMAGLQPGAPPPCRSHQVGSNPMPAGLWFRCDSVF